jgi:hypothetical protein
MKNIVKNIRTIYFLASIVLLGCLDSENSSLTIFLALSNMLIAGACVARNNPELLEPMDLNDRYDEDRD